MGGSGGNQGSDEARLRFANLVSGAPTQITPSWGIPKANVVSGGGA